MRDTLRSALLAASFVVAAADGARSATVKNRAAELRSSYDFVIAGGGTAGLTVADRLSEAFPERTVLVVEYGKIEPTPGTFEPPGTKPAGTFDYLSPPIPGLGNRGAILQVGRTVGGSSATNGQFFDRASRLDYDEWDKLAGNETGEDGEVVRWNWESLLPYFKKSVTFVEPTTEEVEEYGITWDTEAAYGGSTPIYSSWPPFQWPEVAPARQAWIEVGVSPRKECAAGDKDGLCWVPNSQYPDTAARSHSGLGHYADVVRDGKRPNYDLLTEHKVTRVLFNSSQHLASASNGGPPLVEVRSLVDNEVFIVQADLEVVISAGAIHTPQVLQRSGIGPKDLLQKAGIDVVVDLPGVGYNFHDHAGPQLTINITNDTIPNMNLLNTDPAYLEQSIAEYHERPARGPYTVSLGNTAVYLPLANVTSDYRSIASSVAKQLASGELASYLPPGTAAPVVAGYRAQMELLARAYTHPAHPVFEAPFQGPPTVGFLLKPLSRGSVLLNTSNPDHEAEPVLTYGTLSNPIDLDIMTTFLPLFRQVYSTPPMRSLGVVEVSPGPEVTAVEDIKAWVRQSTTASFQHPCCTAAMMPRALGGVVGRGLRVHGVKGLRVIDASIFPTLPGTHTSATVYAIAEKAADIIIQEWSK
ncbi:GMC oxidoreductase-like protein [Xylariaceae sp. FL1651]|nr:GMC oxidoreductase-like protein [Xylariaceae sp. FL1651]